MARELLLNLTQVLTVMQLSLSFTICFQEQLKSAKGKEGDSAIHIAARKGDNDLVKLFIEAGTRVDTQNVKFLELKEKFETNRIPMIRKRDKHAFILRAVKEMKI